LNLSGGLYSSEQFDTGFEAGMNEFQEMIGLYIERRLGSIPEIANSTGNFLTGAVSKSYKIESVEHKSPITPNAWRAPITKFLGYAEPILFLDEVALEAGKKIRFNFTRLALLDKAKNSPTGEMQITMWIGCLRDQNRC